MPELQFKQLQYESDTWKRLLGFMTEENIHLKNRLSEILKDRFNKNLLDEVENFQNRFIQEDELIGFLRSEVAEFDKLLTKEIFEDGIVFKKVSGKLKKLRGNISVAEQQFGKLQAEFNSYLAEAFSTDEV